MESILRCVGSDGFPRIRLGIGRPDEPVSESDYVLSPFGAGELPLVARVLGAAADLAEDVVFRGKTKPVTIKLNQDQTKEGL